MGGLIHLIDTGHRGYIVSVLTTKGQAKGEIPKPAFSFFQSFVLYQNRQGRQNTRIRVFCTKKMRFYGREKVLFQIYLALSETLPNENNHHHPIQVKIYQRTCPDRVFSSLQKLSRYLHCLFSRSNALPSAREISNKTGSLYRVIEFVIIIYYIAQKIKSLINTVPFMEKSSESCKVNTPSSRGGRRRCEVHILAVNIGDISCSPFHVFSLPNSGYSGFLCGHPHNRATKGRSK